MTISRALFGTVSLLALLTASPAFAGGQPQPTPPGGPESSSQDDDPANSPENDSDAAAEAQESAGPLETGTGEQQIIVTGSRISRPEFAFPNPIQSYTSEAIEQGGDINLTDFLLDNPALVGSSGNADASGSNTGFQEAGLNLLNLRNLGTNRTLVLVNGRRHVAAYPGSASVDVNSIPVDLLDRVDVLTGGTSAIYGADGVSGVVNFVLRRDFEGLRARAQAGISQDGDAGNRFASVLYGRNFADGRGNIVVGYEYAATDRLNDKDRPFTGDPLRRFELLRQAPPTDRPDNPSVFDRVLVNDVRWQDSSPGGAVDLDLDGVPDFTGEGTPYNRGLILPGTGGRTLGGSGTTTAGYFGDFVPELERHNVNALGSFTFSPAFRLFFEGKYVHTEAFTISQPSFDFFTYLAPDNAFLIQRFGAGAAPDGAFISRDNLDFGIRGQASDRDTYRGVIGVDGNISDNIRYELYYTYGRAEASTTNSNDRIADRYFAALDAVTGPNGQVTCRINLAGQTVIDPNNFDGPPTTFTRGQCVPLNILGNGSPSPAALDFVLADHIDFAAIEQNVVSGYIAGDLGQWFELPGGPIGFAIGAEYRKESSTSIPSELSQNGELLDTAQILPESGSFDVKEVFAELNVPILRDVPFFENLSVGGAVRLSEYSTVGATTTYNVNGIWAPIRDISFRGTYSQAVRAPNINELFQPLSGTFEFITDPCDITNRGSGSSSRAANCQTLLAGLGLTPAQIANFSPSTDAEASTSRPGQTGGNANLGEETARTWTAGVVLRPRFIPGLTVSADWYDIELSDAINTFTSTQAFSLCVDQPTLDNPFCPQTSRDPKTGFPNGFTLRPANVATFVASGLDVNFNYRFTIDGIGNFNARVVGGYLNNLTFVNTPGAEPDEDVDEPRSPQFVGTLDLTWTSGPLTVNYGLAWQSETRRFTTEQLRGNPDLSDPIYFFYKERWEHDIQVALNVADRFTFYMGVNNFTDQKPDVASAGQFPISPVGRYFYAGARVSLDRIGDLLGR